MMMLCQHPGCGNPERNRRLLDTVAAAHSAAQFIASELEIPISEAIPLMILATNISSELLWDYTESYEHRRTT